MEERKLALLIDSDNISAKYIKYIVDEISKFGTATYKRIYGDFTNSQARAWNEILLNYSIVPMQQFSYTTGKNATDSAMIIDAMDILYSGEVNGFCLVSSDSDFTRLAMRLREAGMLVLGMGEKKTPDAFINSCEQFIYLENLEEEEEETVEKNTTAERAFRRESTNRVSRAKVEKAIISIITDNDNQGKETGVGELGSRLLKRFRDFDVRNYGYTKFSKFLEQFESLEVVNRGNNGIYVRVADKKLTKIEQEIMDMLNESKKGMLNIGEVNKKLKELHPGFDVKQYGYKKISVMLKNFKHLKVDESYVKKKD